MNDAHVFVLAGAYDDLAGAEADYDTIETLRDVEDIGRCDAAIVNRRADGKVTITRAGKPTSHSGAAGMAAGAASAVLFPFLLPDLIPTGAAGAGLGAWFGHLARGTDRQDVRDAGAVLDEGAAALIVVGLGRDAARLRQLIGAKKHTLKHVRADFDEAETEAREAMERAV
jgi:uncharacterized membrane protein